MYVIFRNTEQGKKRNIVRSFWYQPNGEDGVGFSAYFLFSVLVKISILS